MPVIIKHLLFQKIAAQPELQRVIADFAKTTGIQVELLDHQGLHPTAPPPPAPMCACLQQCQDGKRLCHMTLRNLIRRSDTGPSTQICDVGLIEAVIPLHYSGILIAYLRLAGLRPQAAARPHFNRTVHLLRRAGIHLDRNRIEPLLNDSLVMTLPTLRASLHLLHLAIQQVIHQLGAGPDEQTTTALPELVEQAVRLIRKHALRENLTLEDVAESCQVTPSHLSRTFHRATGLTFREYMSTFRAHHAHDLLINSNKPITAVALEAGFQSFSQFNRVMKKTFGQSPRTLRKTHQERFAALQTNTARPEGSPGGGSF